MVAGNKYLMRVRQLYEPVKEFKYLILSVVDVGCGYLRFEGFSFNKVSFFETFVVINQIYNIVVP